MIDSAHVTAKPSENALRSQLVERLERHLSPVIAGAVLRSVCTQCGVKLEAIRTNELPMVIHGLERSLSLYLKPDRARNALNELKSFAKEQAPAAAKSKEESSFTFPITSEMEVCNTRAQVLKLLHTVMRINRSEAVFVTTVVSELGRNILQYAQKGTIKIEILAKDKPGVRVIASDNGPGIKNVQEVLSGAYHSSTGLGLGLVGSKRIMDEFDVVSKVGKGTTVTATKYFTKTSPNR